MKHNYSNCPVCGDSSARLKIKLKGFLIVKCSFCTLERLHPSPSRTEIRKLYGREYFQKRERFADGGSGYSDYENLRSCLLSESIRKLKYIQRFTDKKNILDIGAGTGVFAKFLKLRSYKVDANDASPYACKKLAKNNINTYEGSVNTKVLPKGKHDIVTAWDVIEHLPNLNEAIRAVVQSLKPGGYFFSTSPSTDSFDAKVFGNHWYGYTKIPEHLFFFNKKAITSLLNKHGFDVVDVRSWGFVRSLGFVSSKLSKQSKPCRFIDRLVQKTYVKNIKMFFPFTDFLVTARKR